MPKSLNAAINSLETTDMPELALYGLGEPEVDRYSPDEEEDREMSEEDFTF